MKGKRTILDTALDATHILILFPLCTNRVKSVNIKYWRLEILSRQNGNDILEISGRYIYIDLVRALYRLQWKIVKYFLCQDGQDKFPYFSRIPAHTLSLWFFILRRKFFFSDIIIFEQRLFSIHLGLFNFCGENYSFPLIWSFLWNAKCFSLLISSFLENKYPFPPYIIYQKINFSHLILSVFLIKNCSLWSIIYEKTRDIFSHSK